MLFEKPESYMRRRLYLKIISFASILVLSLQSIAQISAIEGGNFGQINSNGPPINYQHYIGGESPLVWPTGYHNPSAGLHEVTGELYDLNHLQASSQDGDTFLRIRRRSTTGHGIKQDRLPDGKTMVMVSSKSGKFNQVLPLDDLIVLPASDRQLNSAQVEINPISGNNQQDSPGFNGDDSNGDEPSLAQLTAAGTATGLIVGDLFRQQTDPNESGVYGQEATYKPSYIYNRPTGDLDLTAVRSVNDGPGEVANRQDAQEQNEADQGMSAEQMPDSIEGLMRSEGEDVGDQEDQNDQSASNQVQDHGQGGINESPSSDDEADEEGSAVQESESLVPASLPMIPQYHGAPMIRGGQEASLQHPEASLINSSHDLNAAAGHYHGKKKKKKVVKKKKKVKIVYKKKKKKKVKKVKIVKYKKKKKKKKSKKMHHHDHGKYYMYAKVPKKKSWEFGFKRGNKKHWIERHEKGHKNKFKTKVKWYDKKSKGKGLHIWDYNHHDKKKKKHYGR